MNPKKFSARRMFSEAVVEQRSGKNGTSIERLSGISRTAVGCSAEPLSNGEHAKIEHRSNGNRAVIEAQSDV